MKKIQIELLYIKYNILFEYLDLSNYTSILEDKFVMVVVVNK